MTQDAGEIKQSTAGATEVTGQRNNVGSIRSTCRRSQHPDVSDAQESKWRAAWRDNPINCSGSRTPTTRCPTIDAQRQMSNNWQATVNDQRLTTDDRQVTINVQRRTFATPSQGDLTQRSHQSTRRPKTNDWRPIDDQKPTTNDCFNRQKWPSLATPGPSTSRTLGGTRMPTSTWRHSQMHSPLWRQSPSKSTPSSRRSMLKSNSSAPKTPSYDPTAGNVLAGRGQGQTTTSSAWSGRAQ